MDGVSSSTESPLKDNRIKMEVLKIKRYCKNVDITDRELISIATYKCLKGKYYRNDTLQLLSTVSGLTTNQLYYIMKKFSIKTVFRFVELIIDQIRIEIFDQDLKFVPIWYKEKIDTSNGKLRRIGIQNVKQQIYDYIAVEGLQDMFKRIGEHQYASIKGRGQLAGARRLKRWMRNKKLRCIGKADVKKCFPSIDHGMLMYFLYKYIKNDDLLWLIQTLVDSFEQGLSIGSYLSQYLCNLYMSQLYHEISERMYRIRKKRDGTKQRVNLTTHVLIYMDDIFISGTNTKDLHKAMKLIIKFAKERMGLTIKKSWIIATCKFRDKMHDNDFVDMMGFRVYRWHMTIRKYVFKRIRRCCLRILRRWKTHKIIPIAYARKALSYYGILKHTNSFKITQKYKVTKIINICKKVVKTHDKSTIFRTTTCRQGF